MNFLQKTKRYLDPLRFSKKTLILQIIILFVYQIGKIVPLMLLIVSQKNSQNINLILFIALGYVIIGGIIVQCLRKYYWLLPAYGYEKYIISHYLPIFLKKDNISYEKNGTGRMISIIDRGIQIWTTSLSNGMIFIINSLVIGSFIVGRMLNIGIYYGIMVIILIVLILFWIIWSNNKALIWKKLLKESEGEFSRHLVRIFMSKFETLQSSRISEEVHKLNNNVDEQVHIADKRNRYLSYMYDVPFFGFLILIVGFYCWFHFGNMNFPNSILVEFIGVSLLAQSMLLPYIDFIKDFSKEFTHIEKLWDFMDNTPQIEGYDTGEKFHYGEGNYELKKIDFSYSASSEVLKDFSLTIQGGKKTALVGRSGGGKTTLMKLLAGYMRPTSGELLIDGQNITSIRLDSYYPHIGYLTQEPSVFDGTIEENLLYGTKKKPTKKDIEQAIELSECQFIYELEKGVKTEIGERGVRLSGGQKQRLAIAKIFLKDPEIILLDEPTAALDSYSEQKIAKAFEHLFVGRTVIVIAHRLQTVKSADDIIVLEKGKIVERGTHAELLKLGKKYAGMVDLQSGVVREENESEEVKNNN